MIYWAWHLLHTCKLVKIWRLRLRLSMTLGDCGMCVNMQSMMLFHLVLSHSRWTVSAFRSLCRASRDRPKLVGWQVCRVSRDHPKLTGRCVAWSTNWLSGCSCRMDSYSDQLEEQLQPCEMVILSSWSFATTTYCEIV